MADWQLSEARYVLQLTFTNSNTCSTSSCLGNNNCIYIYLLNSWFTVTCRHLYFYMYIYVCVSIWCYYSFFVIILSFYPFPFLVTKNYIYRINSFHIWALMIYMLYSLSTELVLFNILVIWQLSVFVSQIVFTVFLNFLVY